ncbi:MAG: enoyl-CoA hydratase/isomerase family protein [Proteobacteria bacterium]|nr:enoyl-CoA hydratase/isomerase family protein [Pseudomonadota bacterium]
MSVILESSENGIYTITLNRPDKKNSMNSELLVHLHKSLQKADNSGAQIIVIRGSGKAFCAGGDLIEFKESKDPGARIDTMAGVLHESIKLIRNTGAVVIAVLEGVAVGAGIGLSLACDLSVATKNTVMNMGYRRIGLTPDGGGSILLSRLVGAKRFNEFYLLSRNIDMAEAKELGLVNVVVEEDELEGKLTDLIKEIKMLPMETIKYFKDLVNDSLFSGLDNHLDKERFYVSELAGKPLFKERLAEFFSRR